MQHNNADSKGKDEVKTKDYLTHFNTEKYRRTLTYVDLL